MFDIQSTDGHKSGNCVVDGHRRRWTGQTAEKLADPADIRKEQSSVQAQVRERYASDFGHRVFHETFVAQTRIQSENHASIAAMTFAQTCRSLIFIYKSYSFIERDVSIDSIGLPLILGTFYGGKW